MTTLIILLIILIGGCVLLHDILATYREEGMDAATPAEGGRRQLCLTCGEETNGMYYCGEDCYPSEEEDSLELDH